MKKEGYLAVRTKASSHLCDKHMRRYDKKLLLESLRGHFTKLSTKFRLIFAFSWNFSAQKTWNQKTSRATRRPDPWHGLLAVKSSGASISGSSGVVKSSDAFEVNLQIFLDFHLLGSWQFQREEFLRPEIQRKTSWKTKKKKSFINLSLWCIFSPGKAFFRKLMNFRPTNEACITIQRKKLKIIAPIREFTPTQTFSERSTLNLDTYLKLFELGITTDEEG